jgi:hypothetical protein
VNGARSTTDIAAAMRHLSTSLPYTRLFGAHFGIGAVTGSVDCVNRRKRQLDGTGALVPRQ